MELEAVSSCGSTIDASQAVECSPRRTTISRKHKSKLSVYSQLLIAGCDHPPQGTHQRIRPG